MTLRPRFDPYRAAMVPSVIPLAKAAEPEMPPVVYTLLGVPYTVVPDFRHGFLFKAARRKPAPGQMSLFGDSKPKTPKAPGTGGRKKMQEGAIRMKNGQQQVLKNSRWRNVEGKGKGTPKPGLSILSDDTGATLKPKARKGKEWQTSPPAKAPAAVGGAAMGTTSLRPKAKVTLPTPSVLGDEDIFEDDAPATPVEATVVADDEPTTLRPKIRSRAERQKDFDDLKNTMQDAARSAIRGAAEVADFYEGTVAAVAEGMGVGDAIGEVGGNRAMAEAMLAERDPLQAEPTTLRPKRRTRAERQKDMDEIKQNLYDAGVSTVQAAQELQQMGDIAAGAVADAYDIDLGDDAGLGGTNAPQLEPALGDMLAEQKTGAGDRSSTLRLKSGTSLTVKADKWGGSHITSTEKQHIKAGLEQGATEWKVGRKHYKIAGTKDGQTVVNIYDLPLKDGFGKPVENANEAWVRSKALVSGL